MEYRVEQFAAAAAVSVDTVRFYQSKGLLPPPRRAGRIALYDGDHLARLRQIRDLQARGFSLGVIRRVLAGELDAADRALVEAVAADHDGRTNTEPEELLTLSQLAQRAGTPVTLLQALEREGVLIGRRYGGEARYTDADLVALRAGLRLLEHGLPLSGVLELAQRHQQAVRAVAEQAVMLFDEHVRQTLRASQLGEAEAAARLVEAFRELLPATVTLVAHHFRRTLLAVAQDHIEAVGDEHERAAVQTESARNLDVGWAVEA